MSNAGTITSADQQRHDQRRNGGSGRHAARRRGRRGDRESGRDRDADQQRDDRRRRAAETARTSGAPGDAIYSAGAGASIGPITNSGKIIGNVEIDNQASVTVTGGSGKPFGKWTGGTITIGNGDLTFVRNTALRDDISVDGGKGTVTNMGRLRLAAPETIAGNFTQAPAGVLVLNFAGDVLGEYGALTVTKLTTLDGRLTIDLTGGFTLATGDSFDILAFGSLTGPASTRLRSTARPAPHRARTFGPAAEACV